MYTRSLCSSVAAYYHHYHFPLAPAVELAEEDSLPATEQQLAVVEGDGDARARERSLDVCVGVLLAVAEAHAVLRDERAKRVEHVGGHVRVGVLVDGEAGGRVAHVEVADAFARARLAEAAAYVVRELD